MSGSGVTDDGSLECGSPAESGQHPTKYLILRGRGPLLQVKKAGLSNGHRENLDLHSRLWFQSSFEEGYWQGRRRGGRTGCARPCLHRLDGLAACAGHLDLKHSTPAVT